MISIDCLETTGLCNTAQFESLAIAANSVVSRIP